MFQSNFITAIKLKIINFHYKTINFILKVIFFLLFKSVSDKSKIKRVLIFRTGYIGDNICAFPALNAIKENFPLAKLDILTNTGSEKLVAIDKLINPKNYHKIINYDSKDKKKLIKILKKNTYDLVIELTQVDSPPTRLIRNMFIMKFIGIKYAFQWQYSISFIFPKHQEKYISFENETNRLLNGLKQNGLKVKKIAYPYNITDQIITKTSLFFKNNKINDKSKNIGIAIGSKLERNKWPLNYFIEFCSYFEKKGYNILIFGGKEDTINAEKIKHEIDCFNLCGKFSPLESIQAIKNCVLFISNDSGPLHMAYSVNTAVIGLFSSREYPGKWFPPEKKENYVFRSQNIKCSICWKKGINKKCNSNICLQQIKPSEVIKKAEKILTTLRCFFI